MSLLGRLFGKPQTRTEPKRAQPRTPKEGTPPSTPPKQTLPHLVKTIDFHGNDETKGRRYFGEAQVLREQRYSSTRRIPVA